MHTAGAQVLKYVHPAAKLCTQGAPLISNTDNENRDHCCPKLYSALLVFDEFLYIRAASHLLPPPEVSFRPRFCCDQSGMTSPIRNNRFMPAVKAKCIVSE